MSDESSRSNSRLRIAYEVAGLVIISVVAGQFFTLFTGAECHSWISECAVEWRLLHVAGSAFFFSSSVAVFLLPLALREFSRAHSKKNNADSDGRARPTRLRFWIYCNLAAVLLMHLALYTFGSIVGSG